MTRVWFSSFTVHVIILYGFCHAVNFRKFVKDVGLQGYACREENVVFNIVTNVPKCGIMCLDYPTCLSIVYNPETHLCTGCASFTGELDAQHNSLTFLKRGYEYIGCFVDCPRTQSTSYITSSSMTTETCVNHCLTNDFAYTLTQYGMQCFCGNNHNYTQLNVQVPDAECNFNCHGDSSQKCGGSCRGSLYRTGM